MLPDVAHLEVPCSGHFVNFRHATCMEHAIALAAARVLDEERGLPRVPKRVLTPCLNGQEERAATAGGGGGVGVMPRLRRVGSS